MLNSKTRNILNQLTPVNTSMIISYPITTVIMGKSIQAFVNMEAIGEEAFDEIGIFNFAEFNSVINVLEDPEITNDNGTLTIKSGNNSITYGTTLIDIIESECRGKPELISKVKTNEVVMEFELQQKDLDKIKKMSNLLKELSDLEIQPDGDNINLIVKSVEKSSNNFTITLPGASNITDTMTITMDKINKLPMTDYIVRVYKSTKGSLLSVFESSKAPGLDLILAAKS